MREYNSVPGWKHTGDKKRAHWCILTLDDLPKNDGKYRELITQLKTRYQADREDSPERVVEKNKAWSKDSKKR